VTEPVGEVTVIQVTLLTAVQLQVVGVGLTLNEYGPPPLGTFGLLVGVRGYEQPEPSPGSSVAISFEPVYTYSLDSAGADWGLICADDAGFPAGAESELLLGGASDRRAINAPIALKGRSRPMTKINVRRRSGCRKSRLRFAAV
jgi:hypothetical protein